METECTDPDNEQCKEVFARFGLAAYRAQCFESTLQNLMLIDAKLKNVVIKPEDLEAKEVEFQKKTLGNLLREIRRFIELNDLAESLMNNALERRNFLIHHYFRERALHFVNTCGRDEMIAELIEIANLMIRADILLQGMCNAVLKHYGVDEACLKDELAKLLGVAKKNWPNGSFCEVDPFNFARDVS